jgi:starch phosphorylase
VRTANKEDLSAWLEQQHGLVTLPGSMFDIQVKRIHEYKRQLLNVLHVITLYNRVRRDPHSVTVPRTVMVGGKAAPSYTMAKLIIKLVNSVAAQIRRDTSVNDLLRLEFVPNYCVSTAQRLLGACDLSEQISTAGMEASGTGNMKFALNGALIIGTLDGANVEIMEQIGADNIFIFGHDASEVQRLRQQGYNSRAVMEADPELALTLRQIGDGTFSPGEPGLFRPILETLLDRGDYFQVLADYHAYIECQERVNQAYLDPVGWTRRSIMSVAGMGFFSSDRSIREYVRDIWEVKPT